MSKFNAAGDHVECRVLLRPKAAQIEVQSFRGGRRIVGAMIAVKQNGLLQILLDVDPTEMTRDHHDKVPVRIHPTLGQYLDTTA